MYFIKNPKLLKKMYPSLVWDIPSASKTLYLSFDDGPIPEVTPFVLETLAKYNAKASFFCIGDNVRKHPIIYKQVVAFLSMCTGGKRQSKIDYLFGKDLDRLVIVDEADFGVHRAGCHRQ